MKPKKPKFSLKMPLAPLSPFPPSMPNAYLETKKQLASIDLNYSNTFTISSFQDLLKNNLSDKSLNLDDVHFTIDVISSYHEYDESFYTSIIEVFSYSKIKTPNYDQLLEKYEKDLAAYKILRKEYLKKLKQYKVDRDNYQLESAKYRLAMHQYHIDLDEYNKKQRKL